MKKLIMALLMFALLAAVPGAASDVFPDLELNGDMTPDQAALLGVDGAPLKISDIPAEFLFVEVFSMYCPICQRDAPTLNELHRAIVAADPEGRIRFIGLGAGNTPFEVKFYAKKYKLEFPLFHDEDFVGHKALNNVGTPAFYLVALKSGREIRLFHDGAIGDVPTMVETVFKALKGKVEK